MEGGRRMEGGWRKDGRREKSTQCKDKNERIQELLGAWENSHWLKATQSK